MFNLFFNKKFVYFHIDELYRDSITASTLKKELTKRNIQLVYGGRFYFRLLKYFIGSFDAVILPKPHFLHYAKKEYLSNANMIMLYTENIGIIADSENDKLVLKGALDEQFMSGDSDYVDMVSAFCFWGSGVRDTIVKHYPYLKEKCYIVGHPRHNSAALLDNKNKTTSIKKTIGIITRHTFLNDFAKRSPLAKFAAYVSNNIVYEYFNKKTNDSLISVRRGSVPENDAFIEALDAKHIFRIIGESIKRNYNVEVKVHPREDENSWRKILENKGLPVTYADPSQPFTHWLSGIDYLVGPPSTSFFDSVMVGVFPFSIDSLDSRRADFIMESSDENNKLMKYIASPSSIDELFTLIESNPKIKYTAELNSVLLKEADFPYCKDSMIKIADVIENTIEIREGGNSLIKKWLAISTYFLSSIMLNFVFLLRYRKSISVSSNFVVTYPVSKFINRLTK